MKRKNWVLLFALFSLSLSPLTGMENVLLATANAAEGDFLEDDSTGDSLEGDHVTEDYRAESESDEEDELFEETPVVDVDMPSQPTEGENGNGIGLVDFDLTDKLGLELGPVIFVSSDKGRHLINLCEQPDSKGEGMNYVESPLVLQAGTCPDGYRVVEFRRKDRGLGVEVGLSFSTSGMTIAGLTFGIVPVRGSMIKANRFVTSPAKVRELPPIKIPYAASALDTWAVGDHLSYLSSGSLVTYATASIGPVFDLGVQFLAQGSWAVDVTKMEGNRALVQITKSKLKGLSFMAGAPLVSVALSRFKNMDDKFSVAFDLNDETGARAYEDFIRGNLRTAQEIIHRSKGKSQSIFPISKEHSLSTIYKRKIKAGIPFFIDKEWNKGRIIRNSKTLYFANNDKLDAHYGIYFKSSRRKNWVYRSRFNHHETKVKSFSAVRYTRSKGNGKVSTGYMGELSWFYANDDAEKDDFLQALSELYFFSGLKKEIGVKAPLNMWKLGYTGIRFRLIIPRNVVNQLMAQAQGIQVEGTENPFDKENLKKVCEATACTVKGRSLLAQGLGSMKGYLLAMANTQENDKAFVANFARFGKALMINRHTLQAVLRSFPESIKVKYKLEGEKFFGLEREFFLADVQAPLIK